MSRRWPARTALHPRRALFRRRDEEDAQPGRGGLGGRVRPAEAAAVEPGVAEAAAGRRRRPHSFGRPSPPVRAGPAGGRRGRRWRGRLGDHGRGSGCAATGTGASTGGAGPRRVGPASRRASLRPFSIVLPDGIGAWTAGAARRPERAARTGSAGMGSAGVFDGRASTSHASASRPRPWRVRARRPRQRAPAADRAPAPCGTPACPRPCPGPATGRRCRRQSWSRRRRRCGRCRARPRAAASPTGTEAALREVDEGDLGPAEQAHARLAEHVGREAGDDWRSLSTASERFGSPMVHGHGRSLPGGRGHLGQAREVGQDQRGLADVDDGPRAAAIRAGSRGRSASGRWEAHHLDVRRGEHAEQVARVAPAADDQPRGVGGAAVSVISRAGRSTTRSGRPRQSHRPRTCGGASGIGAMSGTNVTSTTCAALSA